ncbi:IGF-like family receptor 1 isoform X6 [Pipistrellus kuhlii]|uniref:IGF-like family receptor 1 isoform X6 n=1 Tax=Pipistrellus kuhlii TaxID=59472 RepID=UPI001E2703D9|nr:IGF-like family receptor 1 isoform X6 [Pipistrellus kuhlii]
MPPHPLFPSSPCFPGKLAKALWPEVLHSACAAGMRPQHLLSAALFLAQAVPHEASQHCSRLEYWNPDNQCCGSCLQRFGPPPCPDYEFSENCGLNDFGDHVMHPFKKCPSGKCNLDFAELCGFCGSRTRASTPERSRQRCEEALLTFALPLVLVLLVTSAAILLFTLQRHSPYYPCPGFNTSQGSLVASEAELPNLASQPLSRLLDELEVLEELIVLLDPEPGPGGALACGTTRHLAAKYGLPASWSTFAYSLRPSHSPLRALIEMVVAREPSASLDQLGTYLAQLGRADALQVLSKLASSGARPA